jgi:hypothetical protein
MLPLWAIVTCSRVSFIFMSGGAYVAECCFMSLMVLGLCFVYFMDSAQNNYSKQSARASGVRCEGSSAMPGQSVWVMNALADQEISASYRLFYS